MLPFSFEKVSTTWRHLAERIDMSQKLIDDDFNPFEDDTYVPPVDRMTTKAYIPPDEEETPLKVNTIPLQPTVADTVNEAEDGKGFFAYYSQYFQVTPQQLKTRLRSALFLPISSDVEEQSNPELYAPIWITASVIAALFFSRSFKNLLVGIIKGELPTATAYSTLSHSFLLFYGYVVLVPVLLSFLIKYGFKRSMESSVITIMSYYGYSNVIWIPVALLSILSGVLPQGVGTTVFQWICVVVGGGFSGTVIYRQLQPLHELLEEKQYKSLLIILGILHLLFSVAVKMTFF